MYDAWVERFFGITVTGLLDKWNRWVNIKIPRFGIISCIANYISEK